MSNIMKPTGQIKARLGIQSNGPAHKFFTETCHRYMEKYVPMDNRYIERSCRYTR